MTQTNTEPAKLLRANFSDIQPQAFALTRTGCSMGRASDCDIVVARPFASRLHAKIGYDGHYFVLSDDDSANGTFVNGRRLSAPHKLKHGDQIGFGDPLGLVVYLDDDKTARPRVRLQFDSRKSAFVWDEQDLALTADQTTLLLHLFERRGELCSRSDLAYALWKRDYDAGLDALALDQLVSRVRARLRTASGDPDGLIVTQRGKGFLLKAER
jgi:hypothetical protein